ncbi:MAG: hypothetical protein JO280_02420 [Mycobacteriaceae bacterium]|nr:hypothetical protein [Mycobacteriaceae bacterium]
MTNYLQQLASVVGPATVMVAVHYWYRRGQRPSFARRAAVDRVNPESRFAMAASRKR